MNDRNNFGENGKWINDGWGWWYETLLTLRMTVVIMINQSMISGAEDVNDWIETDELINNVWLVRMINQGGWWEWCNSPAKWEKRDVGRVSTRPQGETEELGVGVEKRERERGCTCNDEMRTHWERKKRVGMWDVGWGREGRLNLRMDGGRVHASFFISDDWDVYQPFFSFEFEKTQFRFRLHNRRKKAERRSMHHFWLARRVACHPFPPSISLHFFPQPEMQLQSDRQRGGSAQRRISGTGRLREKVTTFRAIIPFWESNSPPLFVHKKKLWECAALAAAVPKTERISCREG